MEAASNPLTSGGPYQRQVNKVTKIIPQNSSIHPSIKTHHPHNNPPHTQRKKSPTYISQIYAHLFDRSIHLSPKLPSLSLFLLLPLFLTSTDAATFEIRNQCQYTVWAAAVPGGGQQLAQGQSWTIRVDPGTTQARIWGRTGCTFDGNGRGRCQTGDCGGLLSCQGYGQPPNTLAEYTLGQSNNQDFIDMSLIDGFNIPMDFSAVSGGCTRSIRCAADINGQCPAELRVASGCNGPCTVFKTDQYCCNSGPCEPTDYSRFFKTRCPDAYSYPKDDPTSLFTCPFGTNYRVVFCP